MEKRLTVAVKKIVGQPNPKEGKWSGVLSFEPADEKQMKKRGRLFAVLDLTGSSALDLANFGKSTLETLQSEYYASEETSQLKALEGAIHQAQHRLVEFVFGPKGAVPDSALNYNFTAASLWGTILYLAKFGSAGLYLHRQGRIEELGEEKDEKIFSASGMAQNKDVVILGSSDFKRTFSADELLQSLDNLEPLITNLGNPPGVSALVLKLELESIPGEEEELKIAPVARRDQGFKKIVAAIFTKGRALLPLKKREPEIYVEHKEEELLHPRKRKIPKGLVLVLAILFLLGSTLTIRKRQTDYRALEAARLISSAEQTLADARQYVDLNNSRARELVLKAKNDFEAAEGLGGKVLGLSEKMGEIETLLDQANKIKRVKPEMVEEATISFDPLAELDSPPEVDESVVDTGTYFGNVYLLVPSENQILKSVPTDEGYSGPTYWVTTENPPLVNAVSMAIDGFIYVLKANGEVLKFEKGELVSDFSLKELDLPLADPRAIFTTTDSEHLYILDAGNRRIVVTDKNGLYQSQYLYGGEATAFTNLKGLFVDEAGGVIYLLDGTKIFKIKI